MNSKLKALSELINKIEAARRGVQSAMEEPKDWERRAASLKMEPEHSYYGGNKDPKTVALGREIHPLIIEEARRRGVLARNRQVPPLVAEINSLRALLPGAAADAAIELGQESRVALEAIQ